MTALLHRTWMIGFLLAVTVLFSAPNTRAMEVMQNPEVRELLSTITSEDEWLNTERALLPQDLAGRIILLDFWTYCCINCIHVMPDLHYLEEKFGNKLTVIGVHSAKFTNEKDTENIRNAILRYEIAHPVVNDADFKIWRAMGARAWPTFKLISPEGKVYKTYAGEGHRNALERDIKTLIEKYGDKLRDNPLPIALEKDKAPKRVLNFPAKLDIAEDMDGAPMLFLSDSGHHRILAFREDGTIEHTIGSGERGFEDGDFATAQFHSPHGVLWDADAQTLFVTDTENHALRAINFTNKTVTTLAGDGKQGQSRVANNEAAKGKHLASPWDLAFYPDKNHILMAMAGTHQLWVYNREEKTLNVVAGNGRESIEDGSWPFNSLSQPSGIAVVGDTAYFVDSETSSLRTLSNSRLKTLIGTGLFDFGYKEGGMGIGLMQHPLGVYGDDDGIYIADSYNHAIRTYDVASAKLMNFAGTGKRGADDATDLAQATFNEPNDLHRLGDKLYITDTNNHQIRAIDLASKAVSTLEVMPAAEPVAFDSELPEEFKQPEQFIKAGEEIAVKLQLADGWKINADAPTYVALYDAEQKQVGLLERDALMAGEALDSLEAGDYTLQGTIYYCEDKEGSLCLIKPVEVPMVVGDDGEAAVSVAVN